MTRSPCLRRASFAIVVIASLGISIVPLAAVAMTDAGGRAIERSAVAQTGGRAVERSGEGHEGRLAVGDSVMLGARAELRAHGFRVEATVARQFENGMRLIRAKVAAGTLPRVVVVHLGNNGYLERADCDRLVRAAGQDREVYLVTLKVPRGWRSVNNHRLRGCARDHTNARLIGWYEEAEDHPGWFADDGYHLSGSGARAYARLIRRMT